MSIMKIVGFTSCNILMKLKDEMKISNNRRKKLTTDLIVVVEFIFSFAVQDIIDDFNKEFSSKVDNVAYNRLMLLGIYLYCMKKNVSTVIDICDRCLYDNILQIFTCNLTPSHATLRRFLEDKTKILQFKKIFIYTLVILNDYDFLKFLHVFIDGTDAIVKGSRFNKITRDQLEALKLFKKWDILLKNKITKVDRWERKLRNKKAQIKDKRILELIEIAENNPYIFTKAMTNKIPEYEEEFKHTKQDYISKTFPASVMLPTKKGRFDFAFNLQPIITEHKILIGTLLHKEPNDYKSFDEIMIELRANFEILKELIVKYGERNNLKKISNLLDKAIYVMDSGYFSEFNLKQIKEENINAVVMTSSVAIYRNKEFNIKIGLIEEDEEQSYQKKGFIKIINGYICPEDKELKLIEERVPNSKKNREEGISEDCKEREYIYMCKKCGDCSHKKKMLL